MAHARAVVRACYPAAVKGALVGAFVLWSLPGAHVVRAVALAYGLAAVPRAIEGPVNRAVVSEALARALGVAEHATAVKSTLRFTELALAFEVTLICAVMVTTFAIATVIDPHGNAIVRDSIGDAYLHALVSAPLALAVCCAFYPSPVERPVNFTHLYWAFCLAHFGFPHACAYLVAQLDGAVVLSPNDRAFWCTDLVANVAKTVALATVR